MILYDLKPGDVVELRSDWGYSAAEWFGGDLPVPGDIGIVFHVGQSGYIEGHEAIWVTFPTKGKYCTYRIYLKLIRSTLSDPPGVRYGSKKTI